MFPRCLHYLKKTKRCAAPFTCFIIISNQRNAYLNFVRKVPLVLFEKKNIEKWISNKLIIDARIKISYLRQTRVSSTKESSVMLESQNVEKAK